MATKKKPHMGRPPVEDPRTHRVVMLLTDHEHELLTNAAFAATLQPNIYGRTLMMQKLREVLKISR